MPPSDPPIEVTLRSLDGLDDFPERKFFLTPTAPVSVGRSSKNTTKRLMSGPGNAFIDSPVISREHALISVCAATGIPTIFIKDNGSMHGTFINSHSLERNKEYKLHSGDELRFGTNVVRDQDSFVAKKYRFHSQIAPAVSRGFSVPDSEEEEDMDIEEETPLLPVRYGSQTNPVNLDDFEDVSQQVINLVEEEIMGDKGNGERSKDIHYVEEVDDDQSDLDGEPLDDYDGAEEAQNQSFGLVSDSLAAPMEEDSEDEADHTNVESEGEDDASNLSQAGSMSNGDSDAETDSESEAEYGGVVRPLELEATLKRQKAVDDEQVSRPSAHPATSSSYTVQATSKYQEAFHSSPAVNFSDNFGETVSPNEIERATHLEQNSMFIGTFSNSAWDSLPPRPAAPEPSMWGLPVPDVATYAGEHKPSPWFEPTPSIMGFAHSSPESRPMKMDYLGRVLNSEPAPAMGMPTPPMPVCEEVNPMNAQANPRTKVSISEIVEDTHQEPPSPPQSVASPAPQSLKRKAEVLDADKKEIRTAQNTTLRQTVQAPRAAVAKPPAKRQRGSFAAAAKTAATFVAGGLFAVGVLAMSPDSTFK